MNIMLAPMEGVVDNYMRDCLTTLGGFQSCVTEFVRVSNRQVLPPKVFQRLCPELDNHGKTAAGTPVIVQLLGDCPETMAANAQVAIELGAPGIDLNFGCPARCVNKRSGGAVLLKEPDTLFNIIRQVRQTVPGNIPVSAKIRLGYDNTDLALDNALAVQESGADFITVHARTKADGYKAPARWEWLARINEALKIPVVANGDINSVQDFKRCLEISGCEHIMIGRGALARPDLARQIQAYLQQTEILPLQWREILMLIKQFSLAMRHTLSTTKTISRIKQWLAMLRPQFPEAHLCFSEAKKITHYDEMQNYLDKTILNYSF